MTAFGKTVCSGDQQELRDFALRRKSTDDGVKLVSRGVRVALRADEENRRRQFLIERRIVTKSFAVVSNNAFNVRQKASGHRRPRTAERPPQ